MKSLQYTWHFLAGVILVVTLFKPKMARSTAIDDYFYYLPIISNQKRNLFSGGLVIDHLTTDLSKIPTAWITAARLITTHYAHTSHGSQILTGLNWLAGQNSLYAVSVRSTWEGVGLPDNLNSLRFYDGNNVPGTDYITPDLYWSTEAGRNYTRSVDNSGLFSLSTWTWCGQQSSNSSEDVDLYLGTLNQLEQEFPNTRYIYFTGHTDGNGPGSDLFVNNQQVKDYAATNLKILFDFADIELYDPSGSYYPNTDDSCPWCATYCSQHPAACANFDQMGDCAHSHKLQCKLKAQAFWWLAARVAGWDGLTQ